MRSSVLALSFQVFFLICPTPAECKIESAPPKDFDCRLLLMGAADPKGLFLSPAPHAIDHFLQQYRRGLAWPANHATGQKLNFAGVGGRDVYNPTAPLEVSFHGRIVEVLAARVEARDNEMSEVMFFEKAGEQWRPLADGPVFKLQDPFVTRIGGKWVFGGVETFPKVGGGLGYRTVFYRGTEWSNLRKFAAGPDGMKDIRMMELPNGNIILITRPQGAVGGLGKIAMTVIDNLDSLGPSTINRATVYEDLFIPDEWGGANELHLLSNGLVGVLGHIARRDELGMRHYYPMVFAIDPATGHRTPMKLILERSLLPAGVSKYLDLEDVLFSGGLVRGTNGRATLYVGAGDAEVYRVDLADPFADFERHLF